MAGPCHMEWEHPGYVLKSLEYQGLLYHSESAELAHSPVKASTLPSKRIQKLLSILHQLLIRNLPYM
jgi:hypothetical protein